MERTSRNIIVNGQYIEKINIGTQIFCTAPVQVNNNYVPQQSETAAPRQSEAASPKQAKPKREVQQDRAYMTFKTTGILPAHLTMLCRKLIQVGWIAKDTQPDDFCNLFTGKTNNAKVTWTGNVGKGNLVSLLNVMVQQGKIAVPENHSATTILEAHFVDKEGKYLTGLNSSKESPKHLPIIKECIDILQLEVDVD